ncbi:hypothetical protein D9619_009633 [Psilocybe cf. subviscida]|uniref:Uncharacterized protein n=1 Tax=Psilocybe cf. subviscida TaxID=2480587 RepID=A0A8H5BMD8_9AGAR|nr:hypothetical protein D9619_009633 [Psilocybe cf. subviscida]
MASCSGVNNYPRALTVNATNTSPGFYSPSCGLLCLLYGSRCPEARLLTWTLLSINFDVKWHQRPS